jgi:beta-lactamase regulating signal transducer with metallopeptidase domain
MFAPSTLLDSNLWHIAGWTMVHFLWLGALVAAAAAVCRFFLRRTSPNIRYAFMLAWLIAIAALPIATAAWIYKNSPPLKGGSWRAESSQAGGGFVSAVTQTATAPASIQTGPTSIEPTIELHDSGKEAPAQNAAVAEKEIPPLSGATLGAEPSPSPSLRGRGISIAALESCIPYLPWLWLIGTPITFALLLTGIVGTRRLRRASRTITDGPIAELLAQLTTSLRIGRRVTVAVCDRIAAPVLIGILRPIILLPPAALTGWSPDEIEMVLLHELAHVRRWDNLLNLLQRLVESLLFFHPAVWLISSWVRSDREACCDAVVVTRTNRPHAYAEMLVALAAQMPRSVLFHPAASSAMAAGPLRSRIRRILQLEDDPMLVSGKSLALMLGALLVAATLGVLYLPTMGQAEQSATEVTENAEPKRKQTKSDHFNVSKDNWPAGVAFSSPKEGEISKRAYELLGLKIVSATADELKNARQKGFPSGLKVLNFPTGQHSGSDPVILVSLGRAPIIDFDALDHVITQTARGRMHSGVTIVELGGIAGGREFKGSVPLRPLEEMQIKDDELFVPASDALPKSRKVVSTRAGGEPAAQTAVYPGGRDALRAMTIAPADQPATAGAPSKFPSLEDQKLADLAWKCLGLELEPIGNDDLKRVKALGYDGGVKVVSGSAGILNATDRVIRPDDILVGLHAWPTTTMQGIADILNRDDLVELNPLKFYVVRRIAGLPAENASGEKPSRADLDNLVTGRVSVQIGGAFGGRTSSTRSGSTSTQPSTSYQAPSPTPPVAPVETQSYPTPTSSTAPPASDPYAPPSDALPVPNIPRAKMRRVTPGAAPLGLPPAAVPTRAAEAPLSDPTTSAVSQLPGEPTRVEHQASDSKGQLSSDKSNLRYDGRSFDEWRQEWLNRRQLDTFKALEAFSAAGYSREAADAILYGLYSEDESIAQHSRKFLASLPADDQSAVVTHLIDLLKTELGSKRRVAAARALAAIGPNAEPALEMLQMTLASKDLKERIASAAAIKMIVGKDKYQKPVADVLGKELGITVVESSSGVWGALPREDAKDTGEAFAKFTEAVIDEQQKLFPKGE